MKNTKRTLLISAIVVAAGAIFVFAPFLPTTTANFGGGPNFTGWVSPSFALFQCGVFIGHVGIEVPSGSTVNPHSTPFWSLWNCDYPRL